MPTCNNDSLLLNQYAFQLVMSKRCFCCCEITRKIFFDNLITINKCFACGTITVNYSKSLKQISEDYYNNEYFLHIHSVKSLLKTRLRQAKIIHSKLLKNPPKNHRFVDYGSGYGIFLKYLKSKGYFNIEALENSEIAVSNLEKHLNSHVIKNKAELLEFLESNKTIDVLSALDVLEHFKPRELEELIDIFSKNSVKIKNLIIKVPSANGFLFLTALWLAQLRVSKALLYKMLQINAPPPHYIYFSNQGLKIFLLKHNIDIHKTIYDADYELSEFGRRVTSKKARIFLINIMTIPLLAFVNAIFPNLKETIITLSGRAIADE